MSDNNSRRAIAQQSPEAKERLRELRRKTEKITNLYLGVRVRVVHKTLPFFFFFYRLVRFFESVLDLRSDFCTTPASELGFPSVHQPQLHRLAPAAVRYCRRQSVCAHSYCKGERRHCLVRRMPFFFTSPPCNVILYK